MTFANKLTLARLILGLITFACLWTQVPQAYTLALGLYIVALVTDWIDGVVARRTHSISPFGALADPVADKVLVIGALIACVRIQVLEVPAWPVFLIVVRELVIGALRALAALQGKILAADRSGKWAMLVQSLSVGVILLLLALNQKNQSASAWLPVTTTALTGLCLAASGLSGIFYLYRSRKLLQSSWNAPSTDGV